MGGRPQQPELARSENTDLQPDHAETRIEAHGRRAPDEDDRRAGRVPPDNRPGHHPERDQDKPPTGAMAARLGVLPDHRAWRLAFRFAAAPFRWVAKASDSVARRIERLERRSPAGRGGPTS